MDVQKDDGNRLDMNMLEKDKGLTSMKSMVLRKV